MRLKVFKLILLLITAHSGALDCREALATTVCLQHALERASRERQPLVLQPGTYTLTAPLQLHSHTTLQGNGARLLLKFKLPGQSALVGESVTDIRIENLSIDGGGSFLVTAVANPYFSGKGFESQALGFSNLNSGITLLGASSQIQLRQLTLLNLHSGIYIDGAFTGNYTQPIASIVIADSNFNNLGKVAIFLRNVSSADIYNNTISGVLGNFVSGAKPELAAAKFADGIYVQGLQAAQIHHNQIKDIVRIAIVLEGSVNPVTLTPLAVNNAVKIYSNTLSNLHGSRGSEFNAGIWVEPYVNTADNSYKTLRVNVESNLIDNRLAQPGAHAQWGIRLGGASNIVRHNFITNFNNVGSAAICYSLGTNIFESNEFKNNRLNVFQASDYRNLSHAIFLK